MDVRGIRLTLDEFMNKEISVKHQPEIKYIWSTGVAITKFLKGLKEAQILGVHCNDCNRTVCPPRMFCEECFNPMNHYVKLPDTGVVNTFSLAFIRTDATRRDKAEIPAVINMDGTTLNPSGFLHLIDEDYPHEKVKVGMKVKAVWKDASERKGDITDIKYFKPVEDS
jgi:uncharacterized OB-fold protein